MGLKRRALVINHAGGKEQALRSTASLCAAVMSAAIARFQNDSSSLPAKERRFQENPLTYTCVFLLLLLPLKKQEDKDAQTRREGLRNTGDLNSSHTLL